MTDKIEELQFKTIPKLIRNAALTWPDKPALKFKGQIVTYKEQYEKISSLITGFQSLGIKKGDHVAVLMGGYPEWFYTSYALASIGAVIVPVNVTFKHDELLRVLKYSDAKALIIMDDYRMFSYIDMIKEIIPEIVGSDPGFLESKQCPTLKTIITFSTSKKTYPSFYDFEDVLNSGVNYNERSIDELIDNVKPDDISYILFTSGSTGYPKPVLRSNISNVGIAHHMNNGINEKDIVLGYLPFYHIAGCIYIGLGAALKGSTIILMEHFDPEEALKQIEVEKVTQIGGFDTHFKLLASHPNFKKTDISSIKKVILAGGPEWYTELQEMGLQNTTITHHYGFSEGTGVAMPLDESNEYIRKNSNGKAFPGVKIKIIDPRTEQELPPNTAGEICLKGWTLFQGYYKMPKETAESFDSNNFFHTGDYGWVDENGYLFYRGRYKNMIKTGGENVSEREVEMFLESHPDIKVVQVIGVPDQKWGEVVLALIETQSGDSISKKELKDFSTNKISEFKIPKHIVEILSEEWPITPTGKYNKEKLREIAIDRLNIS